MRRRKLHGLAGSPTEHRKAQFWAEQEALQVLENASRAVNRGNCREAAANLVSAGVAAGIVATEVKYARGAENASMRRASRVASELADFQTKFDKKCMLTAGYLSGMPRRRK
jgi:imidazolonepropionase-like amidohydrolase